MPNYWIYTSERRDPIPLTGVTDIRRVKVRLPKGTYRDGEGTQPGTVNQSSHSSAAPADRKGTVPAVGDPAVTTIDLTTATGLRYYLSDEMLNTPPRQKWEVVSGYMMALDGATLPSLPQLPHTSEAYGRFIPVAVSIVVQPTPDVCFATGHGFVTGDRIYFVGNTLPTTGSGGTQSLTAIYDVTRIDDDRFSISSGGIRINFTGAGSAVEACMYQPAARILPARRYAVTVDTSAESFRSTLGSSVIQNWVTSGDLVQFTGSTLPTGISAGVVYEALSAPVTDTDEFQVIDRITGAVVALSGSPSGVFVSLVQPYDRNVYEYLDLDGLSGVLFFSDEIVSLVSNVDPNA